MGKRKISLGLCTVSCLALLLDCSQSARAVQIGTNQEEDVAAVIENVAAQQVTQPQDDPMTLSEECLEFSRIGEEKNLEVKNADPDELFWSSDDQNVAMVAEGSVIATGPGETYIRVLNFFDGREAVCHVTSAPDSTASQGVILPNYFHQPIVSPPLPSKDVTEYFDDVIIMGDSTGYALLQWEKIHNGMGNVLFLTRGGVSINSLVIGSRMYFYRNQEYRVEDAVAATGRKKLYIMLGVNDIPQFGSERSLEIYDQMLTLIQEKTPDIQIYLESLTPVWTDAQYEGLTNKEFDAFNKQLEEYCQEKGFHFVNISPYFKDSTNGFAQCYCADDLVHATSKGCGVWAQVLKAYIAENEMEG